MRLDDWFRFLDIDATRHYYAGLNNNRPVSIVTNLAAVARAEFALRRLDLTGQRLIISREASPFSRGHDEERLLRNASHGVYDFDDAVFHEQSSFRRLLGTQDKYRRAVASADVVIAGNDYLANWAEPHNRDVRVIPSCVDPRGYVPKTEWSIPGDAPSLVWLGSPTNEHYVAQVAPALLEFHRHTGALLTLISGPHDNAALRPLRHMLRRIPWSVETFASELASADVAIAPLDDSPFSRGKCAYKLLQYAATALPIVGSPVGANQLAIGQLGGLEAHSVDEWIQTLSHVVTETASKRALRGMSGLTAVKAHYSFDVWASRWCDATGVPDTNWPAFSA